MLRALAARLASRRLAVAAPPCSRATNPLARPVDGAGAPRSRSSGPPREPAPDASRSIAGENTSEYLVHVPAARMAAELDAGKSSLRSGLIALTSAGAAMYLAFYIYPLVGDGTVTSAVQMCRSKDALFRRAGASRLAAVLKAPRGAESFGEAAVAAGAAEALLACVLSSETRRSSAAAASRATEAARDALEALDALASAETGARALGARDGFAKATLDASRDASLDWGARERLRAIHDRVAKAAGGG